jgi:transposase
MAFSFKGVIAKLVAAEVKFKAAIAKAASEVDGVAVKLEADAPEIEAVANAAIPGAGAISATAISVLESLADILNSGNAAAEANLKNAGLDEALIAKIKTQAAAIAKAV